MFRGHPWKSKAFDQDSRRNRSLAWTDFVVWRETTRKKAEDELNEQDQKDPLREYLTTLLKDDIEFADLRGNEKQSKWAKDVLAIARKTDSAGLEELRELLKLPDPSEEPDHLLVAREMMRVAVEDKRIEDPEYQTSKLIEQWLVFRISDVKAGELTAGAMNNQRISLERFAKFCPNILHANEMKLMEFRASLQASELAKSTQRDTLITTKSFLEWCGDTARVIEPIRNLRKRGTGIKVPTKRMITIWSDSDVQDLLGNTPDRIRLFCLLILNTGAYESDIGTWTKDAFDPVERTLTFKRHKEKDEPNVPTVTYQLWDETVRLIKENESSHPSLLLSTTINTPLWRDFLNKDGRRSRKGMVGKNFRDLRKRLKKTNWGALDDLRKTAISKLDNHGEYARYAQYFAGHSPEGTTDRFYRKPSQEQFDDAVIWLGQQFNQTTTCYQ